MAEPDLITLSESWLLAKVEDAESAQRRAEQLRANPVWLEVVPGMDSVAVCFDPLALSMEKARLHLFAPFRTPLPPLPSAGDTPLITLKIHYGGNNGPDMDAVCRALNLSHTVFIDRHSKPEYRVDMIGFIPGFAYLGGMDESLAVPRLTTPRARVAPGSVGLSGPQTGLYPLQSPGGWPLIGRVEAALFDPTEERPFLLRPGMRVRFDPV